MNIALWVIRCTLYYFLYDLLYTVNSPIEFVTTITMIYFLPILGFNTFVILMELLGLQEK